MNDKVVVREATIEDRLTLWEWRNDPVKRTVHKTIAAATYTRHRVWFNRLMRDELVFLCVGHVETLRIGCVRFDMEREGEYRVSMYIKPVYCGRGYGDPLLKKAIEFLRQNHQVTRISAVLKNINPASDKVFSRTGFHVAEVGEELHCELGH